MSAQVFVMILFSLIAVISAVMVISLPNPVHSALSLILNLVSVAVLYYTLNAPFLMAVQLIVYAGAIVVLFLFVVMLLSTRGDAGGRHPHLGWLKPAAMVGALLFLIGIIAAVKFATPPATAVAAGGAPYGDPASIGRKLFQVYLLPFEATSILLLAGLVGAMYLGRHGDKGPVDNYGLEEGAASADEYDLEQDEHFLAEKQNA